MNTPSPVSGKDKSHKRQKLLHSDEILVKRQKRLLANGKVANTASPIAPIIFPNEDIAEAADVPSAALLLIDLSSHVPSFVVPDVADAVINTDTM
jgi:hypothetical protein